MQFTSRQISESSFLKKVHFQNLQKLVGTNLNRPQIFRRAWAGGQVSSFNAYIDKQESTLKGVLKEGSNMQSNPVQNENTNIQYPV